MQIQLERSGERILGCQGYLARKSELLLGCTAPNAANLSEEDRMY